MGIRVSKNKWLKYKYMKRFRSLSTHLPETHKLTLNALWHLIAKYGTAILKPNGGSRGRGVIQVSSKGNNQYEIHFENMKKIVTGQDQTNDYLKKIIRNGYIVQRWISRATVNGRPFDLRVIVQRKKKSKKWKVTAKIAKVAGRGFIVSNITRSNGTLLPVRTAVKMSSIHQRSYKTIRSRINRVTLRSAKRLSTLFRSHRIYGLDVGLDQNGYAWIIEANLFPAMSHFLKIKDRSMYRQIMKYKRR